MDLLANSTFNMECLIKSSAKAKISAKAKD